MNKLKSFGQNKRKITKKKKTIKPKIAKTKRNYNVSIDQLKKALEAVKSGLTLRQAEEQFHVPKSTLHSKLQNLTSLDCRKGPATYLSKYVEENFVKWVLECSERGFPVTKSKLLDCVQRYVKDNQLKTPFKEGRPGRHWYAAFMTRHPVLTTRIVQNLTSTRASVTEEELRKWFSTVSEKLKEKNLLEIDSRRIYNLDEFVFELVPKSDKVIALKDAETVYQIVSASEKATVTVLFTASAAGEIAPPFILFECKNAPKRSTLQFIPKDWAVGCTEGGWMTGESFYNYIVNVFYKWLVDNAVEFPIVLYVDNHLIHVNIQLFEFCKEKKIELIALYPNSMHLLQPLDVAFFHPLKSAYKKALEKYKLENRIINIQKAHVAPVLKLTLETKDFTSTIQNGFKSCGLQPFDENAINYNILNKEKHCIHATSSVNNEATSNKQLLFLVQFETEFLPPTTLKLFQEKEFEESWSGDESLKALFETWKKMKRSCSI